MGCLWDDEVSVWVFSVLKWDTCGAGKESWNACRVLGRPRGCTAAQGIHGCTCAYEPRECDVCDCTSDFPPLPDQEGVPLCLYFM